MQHALPTHAHPVRTLTRRLAWLAVALAAATLTVIQATRHGSGALAVATAHRVWGPLGLLDAGAVWPGSAALVGGGLGFGLRTRAGFQRG